MNSNPPVQKSFRYILAGVIIVGFATILLVNIGCLLLNECYLEYDSVISEVGVCLDTDYQPVANVPLNPKQLFLCGKIEGTTPRPGGLYLFYENRVIYTADYKHDPGVFFQLLPTEQQLEPGKYRVEILYAKRKLASTEFFVIAN